MNGNKTHSAEVLEKNAEAIAASRAGKHLTFRLAGEMYGLEIMKVQEIIKMPEMTPVPRTPVFIKGVTNLRGKVIPVVDLRLKFGMEEAPVTEKTCMIVVQSARDDVMVIMGLIVDEVDQVVDIAAGQIEPPPEFGMNVTSEFILAMGKIGSEVAILLDADKVLTITERDVLVGMGHRAVEAAPTGSSDEEEGEREITAEDFAAGDDS